MPSDDRDPKFERALAQYLRGGSAKANCPDAETLAAYHERNLSLEEMARWKQHISACEACQEELALVEATENQLAEGWEQRGTPEPEAASIPGAETSRIPVRSAKPAASITPQAAAAPVAIIRRRPPLLRWAVPLGAVAAGVLIFIGIYEQRAPKVAHYSDTIIARHQEPAPSGDILDQKAVKVQPGPAAKDQPLSSAEMPRPKREQEPPVAAAAKAAPQPGEGGDVERESRDHLAGRRLEKKTQPPAPEIPGQAATDTVVSQNSRGISASPPAAPPPAPSALGGIAGRAIPSQPAPAASKAKSAPPVVTQTVTVETEAGGPDTSTSVMMMKQGVANELALAARSDPGLILTPENKVFWKLQPAGTLQLTTDGGKKWKSLDTGANANLTAGFAPSSRVCWLAGKAGTLLLTTDRGRHWTTIGTPITGDLGGVHASDARHATIWDAAKQISYETSDGGVTWKQTSGK
jgi:Photosynthesis system II assembly factor YCF48